MKKLLHIILLLLIFAILVITCPTRQDFNASQKYEKVNNYFVFSTCSSYRGTEGSKTATVDYIGILNHIFDVRSTVEKKYYPRKN